jgi:hypothetical protein
MLARIIHLLSVFEVIGLWLWFVVGKQQILIIMCFIFGIYQCIVCVCVLALHTQEV